MKAVISFVCVALLVVSASAEVRTWRDKTGKFSIRAELVESGGTAVKLKREDGKVINVPVDRLSDEDRKFLESQERSAFGTGTPKGDSPVFAARKPGQSPNPVSGGACPAIFAQMTSLSQEHRP